MALTATKRVQTVVGAKRLHVYNVTFDNSYPTGGEDLAPGLLGLNNIEVVMAQVPLAGSRLVHYDYATKKLKLFTAIGTEAANASDQSTITVVVTAIGK